MSTPHIEAQKNDISPLVIMPGDPNRTKYIADKFLTNYKLVNTVRGELAYTGFYKDKRVTVFSSGMGIPSMGIYSYELYKDYDVKAIIRVGSAGSYTESLKVEDLFLAESAYTESNYANALTNSSDRIVYSSIRINEIIKDVALEHNINLKIGRCHSTESFYTESLNINKFVNEYSCNCVEMESFALFMNARHLEKEAACLLTISDSFITKESLSSEERVENFDQMIFLALESIVKL